MKVVVARLVPEKNADDEELHGSCSHRTTLEVLKDPPDGRPLRLGRGSQTGIGHSGISRNAARIAWNEESSSLMLHCPLEQNQGAVLRNGSIVATPAPLSQGDVISIGPNDPNNTKYDHHYAYRVEIVDHGGDETSNAAAVVESSSQESSTAAKNAPAAASAAPAPPPSPPRPLLFHGGVQEEVQCAVCMEICVEATTLVPCSHCFCAKCVTALNSCPTCRKAVQQKMRFHVMDNLIWKLLQTSCSSDDTRNTVVDTSRNTTAEHVEDVDVYLQRTKKTLPGASSGDKRSMPSAALSPRRRRRGMKAIIPGVNLTSGSTVDDAICID